jgi:hypothetical protein
MPVGLVVGKCLAQLLRDPEAGRVSCDIAMQYSPAIMRDHEKAVQDTKGELGTVKKSIAAMASR